MKKLLSVLLTAIMLLSTISTVGAVGVTDNETENTSVEFETISQFLKQQDTGEGTCIIDFGKVGDYSVFFADSFIHLTAINRIYIGDYLFYASSYTIDMYVVKGKDVYSLEQAHEKRLVDVEKVVDLICSYKGEDVENIYWTIYDKGRNVIFSPHNLLDPEIGKDDKSVEYETISQFIKEKDTGAGTCVIDFGKAGDYSVFFATNFTYPPGSSQRIYIGDYLFYTPNYTLNMYGVKGKEVYKLQEICEKNAVDTAKVVDLICSYKGEDVKNIWWTIYDKDKNVLFSPNNVLIPGFKDENTVRVKYLRQCDSVDFSNKPEVVEYGESFHTVLTPGKNSVVSSIAVTMGKDTVIHPTFRDDDSVVIDIPVVTDDITIGLLRNTKEPPHPIGDGYMMSVTTKLDNISFYQNYEKDSLGMPITDSVFENLVRPTVLLIVPDEGYEIVSLKATYRKTVRNENEFITNEAKIEKNSDGLNSVSLDYQDFGYNNIDIVGEVRKIGDTKPTTEETFIKYLKDNNMYYEESYKFVNLGQLQGYDICYGYGMFEPVSGGMITIGDYNIWAPATTPFQSAGLYAIKGDEVILLKDAYSSEKITDVKTLISILEANKGECGFVITKNTSQEYETIYNYIGVDGGIEPAIIDFGKVGDYSIFYADNFVHPDAIARIYIGDYMFYTPHYTIDMYVVKGKDVYTLKQAHEKRLVDVEKVVDLICSYKGEDIEKIWWTIYDKDRNIIFSQHNILDDKIGTTDLTIPSKPVVKVPKISATKANLNSGGVKALNMTDGKVKSWATSNKNVAVVKNGKVTALAKGTAKITATLTTGEKLTCTVKVKTTPTLNKTTVNVKKGKAVTVKLTGKATAIKNKYINTKYAKVTSKTNATTLKVKGLKRGTTTLKIKVNGVKTLKLKVKVK